MLEARHLYIHIPFCLQICPYCSFYKEASGPGTAEPFVAALVRESELFARGMAPRTVFIGGGTPTALSSGQLARLLDGLRRHIDFSGVAEFTIEMNPATVTPRKAAVLLAHGVNRASMGVQSWDTELLRTLGRVHTSAQARESFRVLRESGFRNINLDLIHGVPGQSPAAWEEDLRRTIELAPDHISAYCLTYEEDTAYFDRLMRGEFRQDTARDAEFFERAAEILSSAGYTQYEISNHAQPGRECRHNLAYWEGADYLGLGPSAWSTVGDRRWQNIPDTAAYVRAIESGARPAASGETVTPETRKAEKIAFGLRTSAGIDASLLAHRAVLAAAMQDDGLLETRDDRIRLTPRGRLLADEIAAELI